MLAVVAHDAGGAEVLSSFVRRQPVPCVFAVDGPAVGIFVRKLGSIERLTLDDALGRADSLLCGTSWQSDLEFEAIGLAGSLGKPSVAFLDHWVNYPGRFVRSGVRRLPDDIWVGDEYARQIAAAAFPETAIRLVENPYLEDIRDELNRLASASRPGGRHASILYVCEPIRDSALRQYGHENYWGYTEEEALRYFLSNIAALGTPFERIVIRPHPSEDPDKYRWAEAEFEFPIAPGGSRSLAEEVVESDVVVGCESMALVVGLLANKRVVSCIPPGGKACALPQPEIEHLARLVLEVRR